MLDFSHLEEIFKDGNTLADGTEMSSSTLTNAAVLDVQQVLLCSSHSSGVTINTSSDIGVTKASLLATKRLQIVGMCFYIF